jgi:hypothetical protein
MTRRPLGRVAAAGLLLTTAAVLSALGGDALKRPFHIVDESWLDERLMDGLALLTLHEDWERVQPLHRTQDYTWLDRAPAFVRIAHALGESAGPAPNTVAALERSRADGFRLFEVDLSLVNGELRCQHDPDATGPVHSQDCRFESLLRALPREDAWLVLDIKTDFAETGGRVVEVLRHEGRASQVIFQLYQPGHLALFDQWQAKEDLPGPIVTAYLAHRSIHVVADAAVRAGVRALTLPTWRLPALRRHSAPPALALFVHPVHDCSAWREAREAGVRGVYTLRGLHCASPDRP